MTENNTPIDIPKEVKEPRIIQHYRSIVNSPTYSDVKILVGEQKTVFHAHKVCIYSLLRGIQILYSNKQFLGEYYLIFQGNPFLL